MKLLATSIGLLGVLFCASPQAVSAEPSSTPATRTLYLSFWNESGQPVEVQNAQFTVIFWGDWKCVSLPLHVKEIAIPLSVDWLKQQVERPEQMFFAFLYFVADGYAPIQSNQFSWPGLRRPGDQDVPPEAVDFGRGVKADLGGDKDLRLKVIFRKPGKRVLRFVDETGAPAPGVKFRYGPFRGRENHCGRAGTVEDFGETQSGPDGRAEIRDADVDYLFVIDRDHFSVANPPASQNCDPQMDILPIRLTQEETTVVLHRHPVVCLEFQVLRAGKPVVNKMLSGNLAGCCCAACGGPLATSDENGMIRVPEFYPEELEYIVFLDESGGKELWKMTQKELVSGNIPEVVELPPENNMLSETRTK